MTFVDLLSYLQLLLFPILWYIVKVEVRLTKIETMQSAEYIHLMRRVRDGEEEVCHDLHDKNR